MDSNDYQISFNETTKIFSNPTEHIIRIVVRVLAITLFVIAAFANWPWYLIILSAIIIGGSFIESKRDTINHVTLTFCDDCLIVEKTDLVDSFGNSTKEFYKFDYKTRPAVEYSTRDHAITIRGNAISQQYKCGNITSGGLNEKMSKSSDGPTTLIVSAHEFDGDIVSEIQNNSPLRVEKIAC